MEQRHKARLCSPSAGVRVLAVLLISCRGLNGDSQKDTSMPSTPRTSEHDPMWWGSEYYTLSNKSWIKLRMLKEEVYSELSGRALKTMTNILIGDRHDEKAPCVKRRRQ